MAGTPGSDRGGTTLSVVRDAAPGTARWSSPLRLRGAGPRARGLARAALTLNGDTAAALLVSSIEDTGVVATWDDVVRPVLRAVAQRRERTGVGVEVEHLLTETVTTVMAQVVLGAAPPASARPVLLVSMPGELHALPLRVRQLGANLPADALTTAITITAPAAVMLWSQVPDSADPELLTRLPRTRCYLGGPGWHLAPPTPTTATLRSLIEATTVLTAAAGL